MTSRITLENKKGTTLVEILVAVLVFSLALGALLNTLSVIVDLIDTSRDKATAITHLKNVMERIRATPFDYLTTRFPNGTVNGPAGNPYVNITGNFSLTNEQVVITYADPNSDPLEIVSSLSWQNTKGRALNISISTFKTR
ncbi:MAG: hypothetical protein ABIC68_01275 [Candidatus Omnitrophota bacterium]